MKFTRSECELLEKVGEECLEKNCEINLDNHNTHSHHHH